MRVASFIVFSWGMSGRSCPGSHPANIRDAPAPRIRRSYARNAQPATKNRLTHPRSRRATSLRYLALIYLAWAFAAITDIGLASRLATILPVVAIYFLKWSV